MGFQPDADGLVLAGVSYLTHHLAPPPAGPPRVAGLAGGGVGVVWDLLAAAGNRGRALPLPMPIPASCIVLTQTFTSRSGESVVTLLLLLLVAMLARIVWSAEPFDLPKASATKQGVGLAGALSKGTQWKDRRAHWE